MREVAKSLFQVEKELAAPKEGEQRDAPKKLVVDKAPNGLYTVRFTAGGEAPDSLKGYWTSSIRAQAAIDSHLAAASAA